MREIYLLLDTKGMKHNMQFNANKKYNNERNLRQKENNEET
jgi:hypothetical protein